MMLRYRFQAYYCVPIHNRQLIAIVFDQLLPLRLCIRSDLITLILCKHTLAVHLNHTSHMMHKQRFCCLYLIFQT